MPLTSPNPILLSFYVEHKKQKPESEFNKLKSSLKSPKNRFQI